MTGEYWSDIDNIPESLGLAAGRQVLESAGSPELTGATVAGNRYGRDRRGHSSGMRRLRLTLFNMFAGRWEFQSVERRCNGVAMTDVIESIVEPRISFEVPTAAHTHWNWAFSKPGDYYLTFKAVWNDWLPRVSCSNTSGTYHFQVVPEPSSLALAGIGLGSVPVGVRGTPPAGAASALGRRRERPERGSPAGRGKRGPLPPGSRPSPDSEGSMVSHA